MVSDKGEAKDKLEVKGLTLADFQGKSLMIHDGGDNYSDTPKPLGGGGDAHRLRRREVAAARRASTASALIAPSSSWGGRSSSLGGFVLYGLGAALAVAGGAPLDRWRYVLGQLVVTATQLMTHYANDYFDLEADRANRTPTRWSGGSRVLPDGALPPAGRARRGARSSLLAAGAALALLARRAGATPLAAGGAR